MTEQEYKSELKPAEENPWYVLATICDGKDEKFKHKDRPLENHQVWNSWIISRLDQKQKEALQKDPPPYLKLVPEWQEIKQKARAIFTEKLPKKGAGFLDCKDLNNVIIDFRMNKFKKLLNFSYFIFPCDVLVDFQGSEFQKPIMFNYTRAYHCLRFDHAHFFDSIDFKNASLIAGMDFKAAVFDSHCDFRKTVFEERVNFRDCEFKKPCNFSGAKFRKEYPRLEGTIFPERITLSTQENTDREIYWPEPKDCKQDSGEAKASCEVLREQMETQGLHEQAHFFFRREMQFASKMLSPWQRLPNQLFACLSAYGFSLKRPLRALGILWFFPALIYAFWLICLGCVDCMDSLQNCVAQQSACQSSALQSVLTGSGLSLSNILQFTGFQRTYFGYSYINCLPWGLKVLGGAQTLLGIPLLFLLLLGLRNRFRLK